MTEKEAIIILAKRLNYISKILIPNLTVYENGVHEIDLAIVNIAGRFLTEIEIKCSVADFRNDAKKKYAHQHKHCKYFYYAMPIEVYENVKAEVPERAGVFLLTPRCYIVKKPCRNKDFQQVEESKLWDYCRLLGIRFWKQLRQES